MSSTYSSILRTELIGAGDQAGTWGNTTNSNFQYIFEQAIAGYVAVTVSPTANNQVLTYVNGPSASAALDQSIYAMLKLNAGTLGANFNIFAPPVSKTYVVWNNTSYTASFYNSTVIGNTTIAGSAATIPAGAKVTIWSDGTSFYTVNDTTIGNFTVTGNLAVGGTLSVGSTSSFTGTATFAGTASFGVGPTAPTAAPGTNTTQLATTAFVQNVAGALGTMSTQNANAVAITGGTMSGMTSIAGGTVAGTTGTFSGAVSGTTGTFSSTVSGTTITASASFSGPGTNLTGTAASLTSGATNSVASGGTIASNVTATTQAVGTNNTTLATTAFVRSIIPAGVIMLWSGSVASVPSGWYLCNGLNGTPNLQDRFIVGAGSGYAVAATGGSADATLVSHTHTATVTDPTHTHTASSSDSGHTHYTPLPRVMYGLYQGGGNNVRQDYNAAQCSIVDNPTTSTSYANISTSITAAGTGISVSNSTQGSSATNANLPPYYALAYIMKA